MININWSDKKDVHLLSSRLRRFACQKGFDQLAEDFSQHGMVELWRGRSCTYSQLLIDFLRYTNADSRSKNYDKIVSERLNPKELSFSSEKSALSSPVVGDYSKLSASGDDEVSLNENDIPFEFIDFENHMILDELIMGETSQKEISLTKNVTESRVSQIVKENVTKLNNVIKTVSFKQQYEKDENKSKLLVDWICI